MSIYQSDGSNFPARPALTPAFVAALAFWALCAAGYSSGVQRAVEDGMKCVEYGAFPLLAVIPFIVFARTRLIGVIAAAATVGFCLGCMQGILVHETAVRLQGSSGEVSVELIEDSSNNGFGETALARVRTGSGLEALLDVRFGDDAPRLAGERFTCHGSYSSIDYERNPLAWGDGSSGAFKARLCERAERGVLMDALIGMRAQAIAAIGDADDSHRLLQALVCGYRRSIRETDLYDQFQTCGLAHLVAVSGAHLVIVTGLFAAALKRLRAPRRLVIALLIFIMVSYFVFAGMPVSALRAVIMSALGLTSYFGGRRASSLNAVGIGIFAIVGTSPQTSLAASFALSGLSTAGIVLFAPLFQAWFEQTPLKRMTFVSEALALTLSSSLLSQPYACSLFSKLPLMAPLANVVAAPLFPFACGAGLILALASVAIAPIAPVFDFCASIVSGTMKAIVGILSSVPYASIPFSVDTGVALALSFVTAFLIWALWPRRVMPVFACMAASACLAAACLFLPFGNGDCIVMLDVGQGDAFLVRSRGSALLVDTGNQDTRLLEQLARARVTHLDAVLISHADDDHCGSLDALRGAVVVDEVIVAGEMVGCEEASARSLMREASRTSSNVVGVNVGDRISIGAFQAQVVWPHTFTEGGGNADSLCLLLNYDGDDDGEVDQVALMTGDAEAEQLAVMLDEGLVGKVDILKVGHHGSRNGSTEEEMRALSPKVALISCGKHNRYGHPTQEILDMLGNVGAATFRTDEDGPVTCTLTPERITVTRG